MADQGIMRADLAGWQALLTDRLRALQQHRIWQTGGLAYALGAVADAARAAERGTLDFGGWLAACEAASQALTDAYDLLRQQRERRAIAAMQGVPGFAEWLARVRANGDDVLCEISMLALEERDRERRGSAA